MRPSFGVSVGSDSVRTASSNKSTPAATDSSPLDPSTFTTATVDTSTLAAPSAEILGRVVRDLRNGGPAHFSGVITYTDSAQRDEVIGQLMQNSIENVETISETRAAMTAVRAEGIADGFDTIALFDLGATGLSVTLVDQTAGRALGSARSTVVSGDFFDRVVREHLIRSGILSAPQDEQTAREITTFCRRVKESLSSSSIAQTPGGAVLLMTRAQFEQAVYLAVEESAKIISELGLRCQSTAQAVVLIGGGAYVPVVATVLGRWLQVPVFVPDAPEMIMARGAALHASTGAGASAGEGTNGASAVPGSGNARPPEKKVQKVGAPAMSDAGDVARLSSKASALTGRKLPRSSQSPTS